MKPRSHFLRTVMLILVIAQGVDTAAQEAHHLRLLIGGIVGVVETEKDFVFLLGDFSSTCDGVEHQHEAVFSVEPENLVHYSPGNLPVVLKTDCNFGKVTRKSLVLRGYDIALEASTTTALRTARADILVIPCENCSSESLYDQAVSLNWLPKVDELAATANEMSFQLNSDYLTDDCKICGQPCGLAARLRISKGLVYSHRLHRTDAAFTLLTYTYDYYDRPVLVRASAATKTIAVVLDVDGGAVFKFRRFRDDVLVGSMTTRGAEGSIVNVFLENSTPDCSASGKHFEYHYRLLKELAVFRPSPSNGGADNAQCSPSEYNAP